MNSEPYGLPDLGTSPELILFDLTDKLDISRKNLIESCKEHYLKADIKSLDKLRSVAADNRIAFRDVILDIMTYDQETTQAKVSIISGLLDDEFGNREVELLEIVPNLDLASQAYTLDPNILEIISNEILFQDFVDNPGAKIMKIFNDQLNQDLSKFLLAIGTEETIPKDLSILKEVVKVVVVAGVTAWLVSRKYRKN